MTTHQYRTNPLAESLQLMTSSTTGSMSYGKEIGQTYFPSDAARIVEPVLKALVESQNNKVSREVSKLMEDIVGLLAQLASARINLSNLPTLYGANLDDGSFLVEWLSPNYRVGFVIDEEPTESIWYLVTKDDSSDANVSGSLAGPERSASLIKLVSYVASNS